VPRDPGLQPERTALSWQRTGVSTVLTGTGAAAAAVHRGEPLVVLAALAALAMAAATAVPPGRHPTPPFDRLVRAAVATVALAAVGILLSLR
jgi:uncharacterized membrane protein YidH (DUF202 family)